MNKATSVPRRTIAAAVSVRVTDCHLRRRYTESGINYITSRIWRLRKLKTKQINWWGWLPPRTHLQLVCNRTVVPTTSLPFQARTWVRLSKVLHWPPGVAVHWGLKTNSLKKYIQLAFIYLRWAEFQPVILPIAGSLHYREPAIVEWINPAELRIIFYVIARLNPVNVLKNKLNESKKLRPFRFNTFGKTPLAWGFRTWTGTFL